MKNIYQQINHPDEQTHGVSSVNDEYYSYQKDVFCFMCKIANTTPEQTGWKFHIALDEKDVEKGFDIIADVAMKNKCNAFKVLKEEITLSESQAGKTVVLYDFGLENWKKIIPQIEMALRDANIRPSQALNDKNNNLNKDRRVPHSQYVMYGNDQNEWGKYIPAIARNSYNETGKADPFLDLDAYPSNLSGRLAGLSTPQKPQKSEFWQAPENWQAAISRKNEQIVRLPVNHLTDAQILRLQSYLADARIQTSFRSSQELGKTIRVTGTEEIQKLTQFLGAPNDLKTPNRRSALAGCER